MLLREAVDRYLTTMEADDTLDGALTIATYIVGVVRNVTSLITVLTRTVSDPGALSSCLETIILAMQDSQSYAKASDLEFSAILSRLGILSNATEDTEGSGSPCKAAMASFLSATRSEYARLRHFAFSRMRAGEMRARCGNEFLEAAVVFTGRATEAMVCFSSASLQLLTSLAVLDETSPNKGLLSSGRSAGCNAAAFHLLSILDDADLYRLLAPLHQRIVLYGIIILC